MGLKKSAKYYASYSVVSVANLTVRNNGGRSDGKIYFSVDGDETVFVPMTEVSVLHKSKGDDNFMRKPWLSHGQHGICYLTIYTNLFGYYYDFNESKPEVKRHRNGADCNYVRPSTLGLQEYKISSVSTRSGNLP